MPNLRTRFREFFNPPAISDWPPTTLKEITADHKGLQRIEKFLFNAGIFAWGTRTAWNCLSKGFRISTIIESVATGFVLTRIIILFGNLVQRHSPTARGYIAPVAAPENGTPQTVPVGTPKQPLRTATPEINDSDSPERKPAAAPSSPTPVPIPNRGPLLEGTPPTTPPPAPPSEDAKSKAEEIIIEGATLSPRQPPSSPTPLVDDTATAPTTPRQKLDDDELPTRTPTGTLSTPI